MGYPVSSYIVFVHGGDIGTHTPAFPTWDDAEEFANSLRVATSNLIVSEPYPVTIVQESTYRPKVTAEG